jgi:hypothetical protein
MKGSKGALTNLNYETNQNQLGSKMVKNIKNNKGKINNMYAIYNRKEQIKKGNFFVELDKS